MAVSVRTASWEIPADRTASAVWLGIIWFGMIMGFGLDFPTFLHKQPPAGGVQYVHAAVFTGWLVLVTVQVVFVLRGRLSQHRRLGSKAGYIALLMVPLGLATGLTRTLPRSTERCRRTCIRTNRVMCRDAGAHVW